METLFFKFGICRTQKHKGKQHNNSDMFVEFLWSITSSGFFDAQESGSPGTGVGKHSPSPPKHPLLGLGIGARAFFGCESQQKSLQVPGINCKKVNKSGQNWNISLNFIGILFRFQPLFNPVGVGFPANNNYRENFKIHEASPPKSGECRFMGSLSSKITHEQHIAHRWGRKSCHSPNITSLPEMIFLFFLRPVH